MAKQSSRFSLFAILAAVVAYAVSLGYHELMKGDALRAARHATDVCIESPRAS
jgi:hypothetical protein